MSSSSSYSLVWAPGEPHAFSMRAPKPNPICFMLKSIRIFVLGAYVIWSEYACICLIFGKRRNWLCCMALSSGNTRDMNFHLLWSNWHNIILCLYVLLYQDFQRVASNELWILYWILYEAKGIVTFFPSTTIDRTTLTALDVCRKWLLSVVFLIYPKAQSKWSNFW